MVEKQMRNIYIKLGGACNLHCKYCHAEEGSFQFNPNILPVLKKYGVKHIVFGGGEPLLYWSTIQQIVNYFGHSVRYKMVSNGTLFTDEIVDFCNQYHIVVSISMDGNRTTRDMSKPIQWDCIKKLWLTMTAVTFYKETKDIRQSLASLNTIKEKYLTAKPFIWSSFPNFIHSTKNTGVLSDRELAQSYVSQMTALTEEAFVNYVNVSKRRFVPAFLKRIFMEFVQIKNARGVSCCNERKLCILADGTICACPYTYEKVGDIFHFDELDWNKIEVNYTHERCKTCSIFSVCQNRCCMEITDNQCYIMREMNRNVKELMEKYNISYDELLQKCQGKEKNV